MTSSTPSYNDHTLRILEFDTIRGIVASFAQSPEGTRRLTGLLPCRDTNEARDRLALSSEALDAVRFGDPLPSVILPDLAECFPRLRLPGAIIDIEYIADSATSLETAREIVSYFEERSEKYPRLSAIAGMLARHDDLAADIRRTVTPELTMADNASPALRSIRRNLARARDALRGMVEKKLAGLSDEVISERTVTIRDGRYVIPVRDSMKRQLPGAVHDRSQTGRTLFIEPLEAIEGNNEIRELELAEQVEVHRILTELTGRIGAIADDLERNHDLLGGLDAVFARARYGAAVDGIIPKIGDTPLISIVNGCHPLLDWKFRKRDRGESVVPLDLVVGGDIHTMVITGPNAGGKTVALKTTGLLVLMALSGIPVPAGADTVLYVPPEVYADIGDEQSIADDLSTFSSHMKQLVTIVTEAAPGALVVLDELGGGTNPADGEAIALALLRKLTAQGALTLASSHHDGLKVYAHETSGVMNASMAFDSEHHRPAFMLQTGVPGSSYAFEIAARMGMPAEVLADAEAISGGERTNLAGLIAELEDQLAEARNQLAEAESARTRAESLRQEYDTKKRELDQKSGEILANALDESKRMIDTTNRRIETVIRELREQKGTREAILQAKDAIAETVTDIEEQRARIPQPSTPKQHAPLDTLTEGMDVWVTTTGSTGVVEEVLRGGAKARVRIGTSKATLVIDKKNLANAPASKKKKAPRVVVTAPTAGVDSLELDIRGMTFDDAREELERFLGDMSASGIEQVRIIHGKGTGALRKKVGAYLDKHKSVATHRLGNWNEGSFGVTVVTLK